MPFIYALIINHGIYQSKPVDLFDPQLIYEQTGSFLPNFKWFDYFGGSARMSLVRKRRARLLRWVEG